MDNFLPLFIWGNAPCTTYVIADEIVVLDCSDETNNHPWLAYTFLDTLARNDETQGIFPKKLLDYILPNDKFTAPDQPCLCGCYSLDNFKNRCLASKMLINHMRSETITLEDFALIESNMEQYHVHVNKLQFKVQLSSFEAFILFSNICFEATGYIGIPNGFIYNEPFLLNKFQNSTTYKPGIPMPNSFITYSYSLQYFEYLSKQVSQRSIEPEFILRLSGSLTLPYLALFNKSLQLFLIEKLGSLYETFDLLSVPERICYSMLHYNSKFLGDMIREIYDSYNRNKKLISRFLSDFTKKFPAQYHGTQMLAEKVFKEYSV